MKTVLIATALVMGVGAFCGLFGSARGGMEEMRPRSRRSIIV